MNTYFEKVPRCEACSEEDAISFSSLSPNGGKMSDWKFCGACTSEAEHYFIPIDDFFRSPSTTVAWLAHMHQKTGMDWLSFQDMMTRFADATNSEGKL